MPFYYLNIIQQVYKKHPNYISYIITCKESELFDNIEDAKDNKNVFHTNPVKYSIPVNDCLFNIFFPLYWFLRFNKYQHTKNI
ncbi:hypothetical protein PFFCH_03435 [Plasmodium falciparum FCH/4]|uniref:Uncharacterized protein n=1 Tax=Plasmodium falciparum FCH/4 TaxID=1036724 RepID=A0A024VMJ3_PLAFA|nr:hypothetical protein PFFCH_03435 [Plasmodium falciparum FCH/4]